MELGKKISKKNKPYLKKYLQKSLKIFLWIIGSVSALLLLILILIQIPTVQNAAKNKAVAYLEEKLKTTVSVDKLEISFPKKIRLLGVYFQDQKKDTLMAGKEIAVNISMLQLLNNKIEINTIELDGISANISRDRNAHFNFDYILTAFSTDKKPTTESTPMEFSIEKIDLNDIKINYNDLYTKNDLYVNLAHLDTRVETFDLKEMNFDVPKISATGLTLRLKQGIAEKTNTAKNISNQSQDTTAFKLQLGALDLSKFDVQYENEASKLNAAITFKKLAAKFSRTDINNQFFLVDNIELSNATGNVNLGKIIAVADANTKQKKPLDQNNWEFKIKETALKNINFVFDDANSKPVQKGIDYKHLKLQSLSLTASEIHYSPLSISGNVLDFKAKEKSGLNIQSFKTAFFYGRKNAYLKNLYLKTPQTLLRDEIEVGYPSIEGVSTNLGNLSIKANLKNSKLGFKDILIFVPTLEKDKPFKNNPEATLFINSVVSGKLKQLEIPKLEISGIGTTKIAASGTITGLPDVNKAYFDLNIKEFNSSAKDVAALVPATLPNAIQLPAQFSANGNFTGTITNFKTNVNLKSTYGAAKINALFDQRIKNKERYDAQAEFDNFDLGKLIKNDQIGKISLKASAKGIGLDPKTAAAQVTGTISKLNYNKYNYQNLSARGTIKNGLYTVDAAMINPDLTFDLISNGSFDGKYPKVKLDLNIDIADLEKLNLHAGPLKIRGNMTADVETANMDYLNGKLHIVNLTIADAKEQFVTDSISLIATATKDTNTIVLQSPFLNAEVKGKYKISKLPDALLYSVAQYYNSSGIKPKAGNEKQQFNFKLAVNDSPILLKLLPEIKSLEPIVISGKYNSVNDSIALNGSIPKLVYGTNTITNAVLNVANEDQALQYNFTVADIQNEQFQLPNTSLSGQIKDNLLSYTLQLKDNKEEERYLLSGTLESKLGTNELKLDLDKLLLNYEKWKINPDNSIQFSSKGIYANQFELKNEGSTIKLQSESNVKNAPLTVNFKDFKIETITSMVEKSDLKISGNINGSALVKNLTSSPVFTTDLTVDDFAFKKDTVGNIEIHVDNQVANSYNTQVRVTGQGNEVNLDGIYKTGEGILNMTLDVAKLNLKSVQGFTFGNLTESTGFVNGEIKITGKATQPTTVGNLKFNDVGFKVTPLNASFKSINDEISFTSSSIILDQFTIKDEQGNDLVINGRINSEDFTNLGFDLTIDATNFKAISSTEKDNDLYYGDMYLDNHLRVKGDFNNPIIDGTIRVNKDTDFTIVLPQSDPSIADREGIVEFIDQDNPSLITKINVDESLSQTAISGVNASVNIEVDKEAALSIVIDKANGDFLKLKGEAQLNGGIDPSGKTTLTGRYELTEGAYEMNFNLIKRKFDIKKGSYILWTGEPTAADINITAVYKNEAAPIDLVGDQLGNVSAEIRNTYKQKIPFETALKMNGELMKPTITFDIVLPDGNNSVSTEIINTTQAKLAQLRQQPDELNKQVFALLLLNRFIGENPFASEAGGASVSSIARQSASKILSQQLNNLAGDLISGVELNFDLNSTQDYTTGQLENRTDLNVGISKKLLNDRLKVTVGSNFGLEGPQQQNQEANTIAGDVTVEYQLSKDGRYKLRAYRINKYQVALQGQVVETGIAFVLTLDYNKFRELFQSKEKATASKKTN
jgi:hypothetical protein